MPKHMDAALCYTRGSDITWARIAKEVALEPIDVALKLHRRLRPHFEDGMRQQLFSQVLANALDTA